MPICIYCGSEMQQFDDNGNEGFFCPNDCAFEKACKEVEANLEKIILDEAERPVPPEAYVHVSRANCWYCKGKMVVKRESLMKDEPYGHFCPKCGHSLRDNPLFGVGARYDLAKSR